MPIDTGLGIVIIATLSFYLRLIILQRQKARQPAPQPSPGKRKKKASSTPLQQYSIISHNRRDWIVVGVGVVAVLLGLAFKMGLAAGTTVNGFWWAPVALGIVAFNWGFR